MDTGELNPDGAGRAGRCSQCGALLAHDQRYCVHCGARRGPLPLAVAATLGELREPGAIAMAGVAADADGAPAPPAWRMPAPRTVSFAVMAMLAFGVVAGSLTTPGGVAALARTFVLSLPTATQPIAVASIPSSGHGAGGGGAGGGGGGGGGSPSASSAAPAQQQTVTVTASTTTSASSTNSSPSGLLGLPPIRHVWVIMLSDQGYSQSFGVTAGHPYLSKTLRGQGELIDDYYGVAPSPLANEIAMLSGQGPTQQTAADCSVFSDITPATTGADSQAIGDGCVYPAGTPSLPDELTAKHDSWRAYVQGIENGPKGQPKTCRRPALGAPDPGQVTNADPYATWTNPVVYFDSLTAHKQCADNDVALGQLAKDLKQTSTTPAFSYIAPDPCDDGSDQPCMAAAPAGLAQSDRFLKAVVPEIQASSAYKQDGLIVITFDQAPQSGAHADDNSCCDQPAFPNLSAGSSGTTTTPTLPTPPPVTTTGTSPAGPSTAGDSSTTDTTTGTTTGPGDCVTGTGTSATGTTGTSTTTAATPTTATSGTSTGAPTATGAPTTTAPTTATGAPTTTAPTTATGAPITTGTATVTGSQTITGTTTITTSQTTTDTVGTTTPGGDCTTTGSPPGGGQVGALLLSRYVKAGSVDAADTYNHFSLLKTIEDLFSLKHLGYAADISLPQFDAAIFNAAQP